MPTGIKDDPYIKDPDSIIDFGVSWAAWLAEVSDTLQTSAWAIVTAVTDPPLVIDSDVSDTMIATVWLSGGKVGTRYAVRNRITTVGDRTDDQTIYVKIKEK